VPPSTLSACNLGYAALAFDHAGTATAKASAQRRGPVRQGRGDQNGSPSSPAPGGDARADRRRGRVRGGGYAPAAAVADDASRPWPPPAAADCAPTIKAAGTASHHGRRRRRTPAVRGRAARPRPFSRRRAGPVAGERKRFLLTSRNHDPNWRNQTLLWSLRQMLQFSALTPSTAPPDPAAGHRRRPGRNLGQAEAIYAKATSPRNCTCARRTTRLTTENRRPAISKIDAFFKNTCDAPRQDAPPDPDRQPTREPTTRKPSAGMVTNDAPSSTVPAKGIRWRQRRRSHREYLGAQVPVWNAVTWVH